MTFGEKLTKLRKGNGYTQEDLAEALGVSRQSVSKWESNAAYPETEKLVRIGELFDCSMDYLLKDGEETAPAVRAAFSLKDFYFERKSKKTLFGLPLWHINIGLGRVATGVFSFGFVSRGIVSFGLLSLGAVSFGVLALGLFAFGCFALGLFAAGAIALGLISFGAVSIGVFSLGALAIGQYSVGAAAFGNYAAFGDHAKAAIAIGKSEFAGWLFQAAYPLTEAARTEAVQALDGSAPWLLGWAKELFKLFL